MARLVSNIAWLIPVFRLVRETAKRRLLVSSCLSVRPSVRLSASNSSAPIGRIFMKFIIWVFLEILSIKPKFHKNRTRTTGTSHEYQTAFIFRSVLLRMRNVSHKSLEEFKTHILCPHFMHHVGSFVWSIYDARSEKH